MVECVIGGKTWTYQYGADGLRRRTTVEESGQPTKVTDYVLDGQSVVREFRNDGPWATYLIGARGVEYRQDDTQTGTPREWNVYDGLGSVLATVNEDGVVQEARVVDVYGNPRDGSGPLTGNWFVGGLGHTYDDDPTGLIYMRARWYDPVTGRFVSEDPAANGANWYAYCNANPVNLVDETGQFAILPLLGILVAALAVYGVMDAWEERVRQLSPGESFVFTPGRLFGNLGLYNWRVGKDDNGEVYVEFFLGIDAYVLYGDDWPML